MIEVKNLTKIYGEGDAKLYALNRVSFDIKPGEFVALMGPSGSGKSTLMHIMGFLDRPSSGIYKFEGKGIDELSDDQLARIRNKKMGFVFQSFNLLPRTTVFDNVKLPLTYSGLRKREKKKMVEEAIRGVGLEARAHHLPSQLSGGEKQRVAMARALVHQPSVIFADEPTGNLDSKSGQQIMEILQELNDKGHTIILVTHEKYTSEMARRIIRLHDGQVVSDEIVDHRKFARDGELVK